MSMNVLIKSLIDIGTRRMRMRTKKAPPRMRRILNGVVPVSMVPITNMAAGDSQSAADSLVTEFATYSDFLDSQITPTDLYYLEVHNIS